MTSYDKDPDAAAVYLYEENSLFYQIDREIGLTSDYRARIKILKSDGTDQANVSIPYTDEYSVRESVFGIDAVAYNLVDGKIVKTPLKNSTSSPSRSARTTNSSNSRSPKCAKAPSSSTNSARRRRIPPTSRRSASSTTYP